MRFLWAGSSSWAKNKITFQHLGLPLFECGTGEFPFTSNEGPILDDPSPTPSKHQFAPEFCSFIEACLQKDADERPTAEQLLSHPFITKYEDSQVNIGAFARSVFDPTQRMKDLADEYLTLALSLNQHKCARKTLTIKSLERYFRNHKLKERNLTLHNGMANHQLILLFKNELPSGICPMSFSCNLFLLMPAADAQVQDM
ncbi:hypothetical protein EV2_024129 [Malus domestica]